MAEIEFNKIGERFFEGGVEKAVLYVQGLAPTAWNGLVSMTENVSGGEKKAFYFDGQKTLDKVDPEEFQGVLEAYMSPKEFDECDGTVSIAQGLFATRQTRKMFNLCYKSLIGNDVDEYDHAYKLHLIYNATASPTSKPRKTLTAQRSLDTLQWTFDTVAPAATGYKPTAYLVIDSRYVFPNALFELEKILYGTATTNPRFPTQAEIVGIMNTQYGNVIDGGSPTFSSPGVLDGNTGLPALVDGNP